MAPPEAQQNPTYASTDASSTDAASLSNAEILKQRGIEGKELDRVMAKNDTWPFPATEDGWVKAHNAIRLDMKDIGDALTAVVERLQKGEAVQPWVVTNLQQYWPKFGELVHHHHDNEERIVAPDLAKINCVMPAKMSSDHGALLKALEDVTAAIKALQAGRAASADLETFTALKAQYDAMRKDMEEHLLEEEEVCLPIMRKEVTMKQFKPIEKKIIAESSPEMVGWFLRPFPSDDARRQWMTEIAGMPGFVQSLIMMPAAKKYRNNWARLIEEVKAGERIAPEPTGCFGC